MSVISTQPEVHERPTRADRSHGGSRTWLSATQGVAMAALGLGGALLGHQLVPAVGVLTWAIALGVVAANVGVLPETGSRQLGLVTKRLLRVGIVLLGFSVSFASIAALGLPLIAVVAVSLVGTLLFTTWLGQRMGLSAPRALLIAAGTSICGASAIAGMEETAGADEEDVTVSIAMVTLFGTVAVLLLPLLQGPFGLTDLQFGTWAGASVHEVGQVVAAASPAGAAVLATAVVVKLTRVLMLAPVVAAVSVLQRMKHGASAENRRTPLVPLFVLGFLACVALRSTGAVPELALGWITHVQVAALGAALFGMGCSVKVASLFRGSGIVMVVSTAGTLFISAASLAGILLVTGR
jgi:uncharacterized integral membrane protein (TIGR00698 family)